MRFVHVFWFIVVVCLLARFIVPVSSAQDDRLPEAFTATFDDGGLPVEHDQSIQKE